MRNVSLHNVRGNDFISDRVKIMIFDGEDFFPFEEDKSVNLKDWRSGKIGIIPPDTYKPLIIYPKIKFIQ